MMNYIVCFAFAMAMLVISVISFFRKGNHKLLLTGAGLFLALFAMFLPAESCETIADTVDTTIISIVRAIKVFGLNEDFFESEFDFGTLPLWFNVMYIFVLDLLYLIAPLLTFGIILSLFGNIYSGLKLFLLQKRNVYIFSDSNVRSQKIADGITKKDTIVFFNSDSSILREQNNTICFTNKITEFSLFLIRFAKHVTFFICSDDETANLNTSVQLIKRLKKNKKLIRNDVSDDKGVDMYVFSALKKAEPILNGLDSDGIRVRRINESQNLVYNFIYKYPVLKYAKGKKEINLAVVGLGNYGEEYLRAAIWSGQHPDCKLNINVFDIRNVKKAFAVKYPELVNTEQLSDKDEINYKINFFDGEENDIFSTDNIAVLKNTDSVFISLGDDEKNFEAAIYLRECFERMETACKPEIYTILSKLDFSDDDMETDDDVKIRVQNHKGQGYDIHFILADDFLAFDNVVNAELEQMGVKMFKRWNDPDNTKKDQDISKFYSYEFNYRSSIAASMFWQIRQNLSVENPDIKVEINDDNMRLEHWRWNAYMRSEGFRYSPVRNDLARLHNNLVPYDDLDEMTKKYDGFAIESVNKK